MVQNLSVERKAQLKKDFQKIFQILKAICLSKRYWILVSICLLVCVFLLNHYLLQFGNWNYINYEALQQIWQAGEIIKIKIVWGLFLIAVFSSFIIISLPMVFSCFVLCFLLIVAKNKKISSYGFKMNVFKFFCFTFNLSNNIFELFFPKLKIIELRKDEIEPFKNKLFGEL